MKKALFFVSVIAALSVGLCGCGDSLERQGYKYDEPNDWYVKDGEEKNDELIEGTFINLTKSPSILSKQYIVTPSENRVVFIGNSSLNYTDFSIVVEGRTSDVYIELQNFKFEAPAGEDGINADDVFPTYNVYIMSSGTSSIKGGKGENGEAGTSYKYNGSSGAPKNGSKGLEGGIGCSAISGNTIYLTANTSSKLTLTGGDGGDGGNGGQGGTGGYGIYLQENASLKISDNAFSVEGGKGGQGGNGSNGGDGHKWAMDYVSKGANPGDAGNGGDGGSGGLSTNFSDKSLFTHNSGQGGKGGFAGNPGSAPKGDGKAGKDGLNGDTPIEA